MTALLNRFTRRYRAALLAKMLVLAGLGLSLAAVLAWRLFALHLGPAWRIGLPGAVALVTGASLGWWVHSRWPSRRASAAELDRLLGLKQRLITAEEFAGVPAVPTLYPLLVADASKWAVDARTRYPRPLDRTAAALFILLLLALVWPLSGRSPLQQLAQLPRLTPPPVKPPEPPQAPPPPKRSPQQPQGGSPQPQSSSASQSGQSGSQSQSQSSGRNQTSQSPSGENQQQPTSGGGGSSNDGGAKPDASSSGQGPQGSGQSGAGAEARASGGQADQGQSGQGAGPQQANGQLRDRAGTQPQSGRDQNGSSAPPQSGSSQGGAGAAQQAHAQSSGGSQSASGDAQGGTQGAAEEQAQASPGGKSGDEAQAGSGSSRSLAATAARAPSGGGGSSGAPNNDALQQEIQQLLKEVSGEIRTLQAQIADANGQPPPSAGTTTDPELYGTSEPVGQTGAGTVPIQLKTDTAATTSGSRAGSGVGRPSGEAAAASPTAKPEPAQLSDDPLEEPPGSRDTVPPEYRDIFDRLNRSPSQPSETQP